jgi:hypothetical protein
MELGDRDLLVLPVRTKMADDGQGEEEADALIVEMARPRETGSGWAVRYPFVG